MIESIMYFGGGFLVASLLALVLISLVHQRAVRLTTRRFEDAIPLSMAEIQADKDNLRAEFAVASRRLELTVEQLKAKSTSQLGEIARKSEAINRLKAELAEKTTATDALEARARSLADHVREFEQAHAHKEAATDATTHALAAKEAELAAAMTELTEHRLSTDTQRVELAVAQTQIAQLKANIDELQLGATEAARRLFDERVAFSNVTKELDEKRRTLDMLRPQIDQLEGEIATKSAALADHARHIGELRNHIGEQERLIRQRGADARALKDEIGRLNAEKTSLESLLEIARNTIATLTSRVADLEGSLAERDHLIGERDTEAGARNEEIERLKREKSSLESLLEAARNAIASHVAHIDELAKDIAERDRLIGQRDAEADALNQQIAAMRDDHALAIERLGAEKSSLERLLQTANHTLATRAARIADLEAWAGERDHLVRQRDREIDTLLATLKDARADAAEAAEAMRIEKAALDAELQSAIDARSRAEAELSALRQEADATWRAEKRETDFLRERLIDVAAQVAHMAISADKTVPIEAILTNAGSIGPEGFAAEPQDEAGPATNLTERIRTLQNGASRIPTAS